MPVRANIHCLEISNRILELRQYIYANANREHAVKRNDMIAYLNERGFEITNRKTLYNDLTALVNIFGLDLEYVAAKRGYILKNPPFEPYELRLMVESIQASKFITQEKANTICSKIKMNLADNPTRPSLNRHAFVAERIRSMNNSVVKEADRLHEAIENGKQISFRYFHYTPDKSKKKTYSKNGEMLIVSPFTLYWDNGNYYLYAYDGVKFRYFRVDRMEKIEVLISNRIGVEEYKAENVRRQKAKVFQMYGGKEYTVKIRFRNELADQVIDQFGADVSMMPLDDNHFTVKVPVQVSPTFFAWIATFGRRVKILEPVEVADKMRDFLQRAMDMYKNDGEM